MIAVDSPGLCCLSCSLSSRHSGGTAWSDLSFSLGFVMMSNCWCSVWLCGAPAKVVAFYARTRADSGRSRGIYPCSSRFGTLLGVCSSVVVDASAGIQASSNQPVEIVPFSGRLLRYRQRIFVLIACPSFSLYRSWWFDKCPSKLLVGCLSLSSHLFAKSWTFHFSISIDASSVFSYISSLD